MTSPPNSSPAAPKPAFGGRWTYGVLILAILFVMMPFLFWHATWFGRPMTDAQLQKALADARHPREIQHALSQIELRISNGAPDAKRWYPQVVALAASNVDEIRLTAAWVMGQDNTSLEFHQALLALLADPQPMVERNAALSLVRFQDATGRPQLLAMLRAYAMPAPVSGTLRVRLKPDDVVNPGTMVARIETGEGKREVRTVVPGAIDRWLVADGSTVAAGQPILSIAPSQEMVWDALQALYVVGATEDLPEVDRYARGVGGMSPRIQQQASLTSQAIRSRSAS
jgi:biotin carboxyl carrier protein